MTKADKFRSDPNMQKERARIFGTYEPLLVKEGNENQILYKPVGNEPGAPRESFKLVGDSPFSSPTDCSESTTDTTLKSTTSSKKSYEELDALKKQLLILPKTPTKDVLSSLMEILKSIKEDQSGTVLRITDAVDIEDQGIRITQISSSQDKLIQKVDQIVKQIEDIQEEQISPENMIHEMKQALLATCCENMTEMRDVVTQGSDEQRAELKALHEFLLKEMSLMSAEMQDLKSRIEVSEASRGVFYGMLSELQQKSVETEVRFAQVNRRFSKQDEINVETDLKLEGLRIDVDNAHGLADSAYQLAERAMRSTATIEERNMVPSKMARLIDALKDAGVNEEDQADILSACCGRPGFNQKAIEAIKKMTGESTHFMVVPRVRAMASDYASYTSEFVKSLDEVERSLDTTQASWGSRLMRWVNSQE